jgi:hypothetical protein
LIPNRIQVVEIDVPVVIRVTEAVPAEVTAHIVQVVEIDAEIEVRVAQRRGELEEFAADAQVHAKTK